MEDRFESHGIEDAVVVRGYSGSVSGQNMQLRLVPAPAPHTWPARHQSTPNWLINADIYQGEY